VTSNDPDGVFPWPPLAPSSRSEMTAKETDRDTQRHPSLPAHATLQRRKEIPATCQLNQGPAHFSNLTVSKYNGTIVFDPHVLGACVMSVDEEEARKLRDLLTAWLH